MTINDKIPYLSTPLPEDILRFSRAGYFTKALSLIEGYLAEDIPRSPPGTSGAGKNQAYPPSRGFSLHLSTGNGASSMKPFLILPTKNFAVLEDAGRIDCIFVEGRKYFFPFL